VANTGLALHRLGIATHLMALTGADAFGAMLRRIVARCGPDLDSGLRITRGLTTSYSIILSPPGVDRLFLHCPGANDAFDAEGVDYAALAHAKLFHFGYPPIMRCMYTAEGRGLVELLRRAKATGVTTSLDMAFPDPNSPGGRADWSAILKAALPYVDVFLPSSDELLYMLRRDTFEALTQAAGRASAVQQVGPDLLSDLGRQLLDWGARIAAIKLGDRGLYLRTGDRNALAGLGRALPAAPDEWAHCERWAPCFQVDVAGTTGSGDATIAGFLSALLRGLSPAEAMTAAVAVGACNCEAADALGGIRPWDETLARVRRGWARRPLTLDAPGWRYDTAGGLWIGPGDV
jgi:sugar/nucleoside kinase (ribokinase family)